MLIILVFASVKIQRLENINSDWGASYQLLQQDYGDSQVLWSEEREQWQKATEGRDAIIEWYKLQPPKVVTQTVVKEVPVEVIKEVITEVEKTVYKEAQNPQSLEELKVFLVDDDTDSHIILKADENGIVQFNGQCEDMAFQLQQRADDIGMKLDTEILSKPDAIKWRQYIDGDVYSLGVNDGHYICKAVIGNEVWYISPENDKIWWVYYLD